MRFPRSPFPVPGALLVALACLHYVPELARADEKVEIRHHPGWAFEKFQRLAVTPFGSTDRRGVNAARSVEDRLIDLLTGNGSFTVLPRGELKDVLTEQDLSQLADVADPSTVITPGKIKIAQAIIVGRVVDFDLARERAERRALRPLRDRRGIPVRDARGLPRMREEVVPIYRHAARLGVSVRVINAATGELLVSRTVGPFTAEKESEGGPPRESPEDMLAAAIDGIARKVYQAIAPTTMTVKLDDDSLIIAKGFFDGEYDKTRKLSTDMDKFLVAVCGLPDECDQNPFKIGIALEDANQNVLEREFVWRAGAGRQGVAIEIPVAELEPHVAEKESDFIVKLYAGGDPKPIFDHGFTIKRAK